MQVQNKQVESMEVFFDIILEGDFLPQPWLKKHVGKVKESNKAQQHSGLKTVISVIHSGVSIFSYLNNEPQVAT